MYDFTVVLLDGMFPSSVTATLDLLSAAESMARGIGSPSPRWRVCSPQGKHVRLGRHVSIQTERLPDGTAPDRSVWVLPGLGLNTEQAVAQRLAQPDALALCTRMAEHVRGGGQVAAGCSAVFLLRAAGLLAGRNATTTWWLGPLLQRLEPTARVDTNRMVCTDGPVTSAGAAFAQTDLMLHLLRRTCGPKLVERLSRFLIVDGRQSQGPYVIPDVMANGDELVARVISRVERSLPNAPAIAELARELCISESTFSRRIKRVTGQTPIHLVQSVRLLRARSLLEQSRFSVEEVAAAVGYGDATALRRLMRKAGVGSPRQLRPPAAQ